MINIPSKTVEGGVNPPQPINKSPRITLAMLWNKIEEQNLKIQKQALRIDFLEKENALLKKTINFLIIEDPKLETKIKDFWKNAKFDDKNW
ncbi:hypothetical protein [Williamsoniiplasma luminosum]|uniref:Uncharacterized protein n=1 Tax=Williamsoniiplasma luminosum TaxID=214888 RepID=A0A2S0NJ24_9MOLU|nr:hypothetical protein [Williamsoniiplasma luminosum]AVP49002.1 MAG: hypothetical protein C5T88_00145 [Williamsoniiplasma luminosum]